VYLPTSAARVTLTVAAVLAAAIWVAGQDLGGILTGSGTDPESGPLLIFLVLAYWPVRSDGVRADRVQTNRVRTDRPSDGARIDGARTIRGPAAGRTVT
jgi:hypothetical protein